MAGFEIPPSAAHILRLIQSLGIDPFDAPQGISLHSSCRRTYTAHLLSIPSNPAAKPSKSSSLQRILPMYSPDQVINAQFMP